MGALQWLRSVRRGEPRPAASAGKREIVVAATDENDSNMTFEDRNITFTGDLSSYDYDAILRDKQGNINSLYE